MTERELPGLTPDRVQSLAATWDGGGLWEDVCWLAQRFWQSDGPEPLDLRWHHLVLAVGNFKRQTGRRLRPCRLGDLPISEVTPADQFMLPCRLLANREDDLVVHRDDEESWRELEAALPGAALATTTTLLAALWPDEHFIFDWRVEAAANALRIHARAGLSVTKWPEYEMKGRKRVKSDFSDYSMVRDWLRTVEGFRLTTVERALYRLSQSVPTVRGRSWQDYAEAIAEKLGN